MEHHIVEDFANYQVNDEQIRPKFYFCVWSSNSDFNDLVFLPLLEQVN
jgi:hypothetical protein